MMKFIFSSALVSVLILTVSVYSLVSILNSQTLNASIAESGIYEKLPQILTEKLLGTESDEKTSAAVYSKVKDDPIFNYLKDTIEKFDNDLFEYLDGKTDVLPFISLVNTMPKESLWGVLVGPMLKNFGVTDKLELPANIAQNIQGVKQGYEWFKLSPAILAVPALFLVAVLTFLGRDWAHRAKLVGKAFLSASIFGLILFSALMFLLPQLPQFQIPKFPPELKVAQEPLLSFAASLIADINSNQGPLYGGMFIVGMALFLGSRFLPKKESA